MQVEHKGGVAWITLSRPEHLNCLALRDYHALGDAILAASADQSIDVIVIKATGRAFCTGGDLKEILSEIEKGPKAAANIVHRYADASMRLFQLMESSPKTIVASINGACLAGGLCIVLSSDVSISSDAATFSAPEAKVGLADPFVPLRLARAIGTTRAKWMMLTADILDARAARNAGLITEVVPHEDLETATLSAVEKLQQTSPITRALYKKAANSDLAPFDRDLQFSANAGSDAREGLSAFVQKRKPQWPSRQ